MRFEVEVLTSQEVSKVKVEDPYRIIRLAEDMALAAMSS
jgi:hypothetical protein